MGNPPKLNCPDRAPSQGWGHASLCVCRQFPRVGAGSYVKIIFGVDVMAYDYESNLLAAGIRSWLRNVCDQHKPERQLASNFRGFRQERKLAGGSLQQRSEQGAFPGGELQADWFLRRHSSSIGVSASFRGVCYFCCEERSRIRIVGSWRRVHSAALFALPLFALQLYSGIPEAASPEGTRYARRSRPTCKG